MLKREVKKDKNALKLKKLYEKNTNKKYVY